MVVGVAKVDFRGVVFGEQGSRAKRPARSWVKYRMMVVFAVRKRMCFGVDAIEKGWSGVMSRLARRNSRSHDTSSAMERSVEREKDLIG